MENSLYLNALENLKYKKQRIKDGKLNCIPFPLGDFNRDLPGIEKEQIVIITANAKVGKTQISDYLYLYTPLEYSLNNPDKCKVKIFYFTLEMSKQKKMQQFMCYLLFKKSKGEIHIDMKSINSIFADNPVDDEILEILETPEYLEYAKHFEECVTFYDNVRNPTGIYMRVKEYMEEHGTWTKKIERWQKEDKTYTTREVKDQYIPDDPEVYTIVMLDHLALMDTEQNQKEVREAMVQFSSKYALPLRDKYKCSVVEIQQQAAAQESTENKKLDMLIPSLNGLGEAKVTSRDANIVIGLFSPYRYQIPKFLDYDITYWQDNIRFLNIIANREGGGGSICPLFFDGATNTFMVLPGPKEDLTKYKSLVTRVRMNVYMLKTTQILHILSTKLIKNKITLITKIKNKIIKGNFYKKLGKVKYMEFEKAIFKYFHIKNRQKLKKYLDNIELK